MLKKHNDKDSELGLRTGKLGNLNRSKQHSENWQTEPEDETKTEWESDQVTLCLNKRNANSTDNLIKCEEMVISKASQINLESVVQSFLKKNNRRHHRYAHMLLNKRQDNYRYANTTGCDLYKSSTEIRKSFWDRFLDPRTFTFGQSWVSTKVGCGKIGTVWVGKTHNRVIKNNQSVSALAWPIFEKWQCPLPTEWILFLSSNTPLNQYLLHFNVCF